MPDHDVNICHVRHWERRVRVRSPVHVDTWVSKAHSILLDRIDQNANLPSMAGIRVATNIVLTEHHSRNFIHRLAHIAIHGNVETQWG